MKQDDIFTTAEQARKRELVFAHGVIDLHIALARKHPEYRTALVRWADEREASGDNEVANLAWAALATEAMIKRHEQDQAISAAADTI